MADPARYDRPEVQGRGPLPVAIDLRILGRCNLRCAFCFGPRHELGPAPTGELLRFLQRGWCDGARALVVTGGEPLIHPDAGLILRRAKELGYRVTLSTNATLLGRRAGEILPFLDWLALPIESLDPAIHNRLRPGRPSFTAVLDAFRLARRHHPKLRIKLGTVLQPGNIDTAPDIPARWPLRSVPDVWKVYEISYSNYALDNAVTLRLGPTVIDKAMTRCEEQAIAAGWRFTPYRNSTRSGQYVFVEPDGTAMVIADGHERHVGNFFTGYHTAIRAVSAFVNHDRLQRNYALTYH